VARAGEQLSALRVALVGYGMGGSLFHAPFITLEPRLDLTVVVSANRERQVALQARYPKTRVMRSVEDLLDHLDDIDLVVVSTPNSTHEEIAEAVISRHCALVVDKPVTPTANATRRLAGLAIAAGTAIVPFQNRRWDGDFRTAVSLLRRGDLGTLLTFESRYERWQPEVSSNPDRAWKNDTQKGAGTGILFDLGSHVIDQAVVLFGRPQAVYAEVAVRRAGSHVDDDAFVALHYSSGPRVHLWTSAVAADRGPRFRLLGDVSAYVKTGMDVQEAALSEGRAPSEPDWGVEPPISWGHLVAGSERRAVPTINGAYQLFYADLASFLLDGKPPPVDIADAITTAEIIEAAYLSSRSGRVESLNRYIEM
jgi:scyllo-inositol 2-dehydrogenase (NADP+)